MTVVEFLCDERLERQIFAVDENAFKGWDIL